MIKHVLPILAGVGLIAASVHAQPELPDPTERIPGSDLWIEARLLTAYALNEHLNPFDIRVDSERGRVQLTGDVPSVVERKLAEQLAKDVGAVAQVDNQIRVQADDSDPTYTELYQLVEDANITTRIQLQLLWNRATNSVDINVDSNDGRVTLSGKVAGEEARERTVAIARRTEGVRSVDDQLQVAAAEEADEATGRGCRWRRIRRLDHDARDRVAALRCQRQRRAHRRRYQGWGRRVERGRANRGREGGGGPDRQRHRRGPEGAESAAGGPVGLSPKTEDPAFKARSGPDRRHRRARLGLLARRRSWRRASGAA